MRQALIFLILYIFYPSLGLCDDDWVDVSSQNIIKNEKNSDNYKDVAQDIVKKNEKEGKLEDAPLRSVIEDEAVLKKLHKEQMIKKIKLRKPYSYDSKAPPRILQQDLQKVKNQHIPKVIYFNQYQLTLLQAIESGDIGAVSAMLSKGINANFLYNGYTPIMVATMKGHTSIIQYLIVRGVDVNASNENGSTALHIAVYNNDFEAINLLLDSGANLKIQDKNGLKPLDYLSKEQKSYILLKRAGNLEEIQSLLLEFISEENIIGVEMAIKQGAALNLHNSDGATPLILAAKLGFTDISDVLLRYGADPTVLSADGLMAIDYAYRKHDVALISILENALIHYELTNNIVRPKTKAILYTQQ